MKKLINDIKLAALCFISLFILSSSLLSQNVGINTNAAIPDPSAGLDVNFPNKGFLMPRVPLTSLNDITTIPNPAQFLMVFNTTTQCLVYFTGAAWQNIVCPCTAPPATPGIISGYTSPCISTTGNVYTIAAVAGAISYTWSVPTGAAITAGSGTTSITVTFATTSGNIEVTATNSCGTSGASTLAINLSTIPLAPAVPSGTTAPLNSDSSVYTIPAVAGATAYIWSVSTTNGSVTSGQGTTSATVTFSGTPGAMNICVYAHDTCGNSAASCLSVTSTNCLHSTATFTYTGTQQTWVVPSCVSTITIEAQGAQGGTGATYSSYPGGTGGLGADAIATYTVTGGSTLNIYVGSQALFNGGGSAFSYGGGGNGGDASDVRVGGTALTNRIIVAGGGGGGGAEGYTTNYTNNGGGNGGAGGMYGYVGLPGSSQGGNTYTPGQNGSASGGGNGGLGYYDGGGGGGGGGNGGGGAGNTCSYCSFSAGAGGTGGGCGGNETNYSVNGGCLGIGGSSMYSGSTGGGGGGGYYGGGGGSAGNGNEWAGGGGGGGGSSFLGSGTNSSVTDGAISGNGQVIITW